VETALALHLLPQAKEDEDRIRGLASNFVDTDIRKHAIEDDQSARFRRSHFDELARLGLVSILTPKEYGGQGLPFSCFVACLEELSRGALATSVMVAVTNLPQGALVAFGTKEQKESFLKPLAAGKWLGAFGLSEPDAGSDAANLKTSATKTQGGYVLNGSKSWCSSAGSADLYLVMARTSEDRIQGISAFLVPADAAGFRIGKQEKKMGMRASPLGELIFENCFIPEGQRLGNEGQGLEIALSQLDSGRIAIGAASVGLSREALDRTWTYRKKKLQANPDFNDGMGDRLAELFAQLQAVKCLLLEAAHQKEIGNKVTVIASQVKLLASELAMEVTTEVIQCFPTIGLSTSLGVERFFRDAKSLQIIEGTNQIQKLVINRETERMFL